MPQLMIYGANGYSGELIAREAKKRGLRPILAGRDHQAIEALAKTLKFPYRVFDLQAGIDLSGVDLVLNCAGPFSKTAEPMIEACLKTGAHYLDITGEISVFALAHHRDARAKAAGVVVCPGVGFDVVPTDCLAALLKRAMPDAQELILAFDAEGGMSRGTATTSVEGLSSGGQVRVDGVLTVVPSAWKVRDFEFAAGRTRRAMTIPWGDVYTAFISTGIANVSVYMALPPATIAAAKRLRWVAPILGLKMVQNFMKWRIKRRAPGPDEQKRAQSRSYVYGQVTGPGGKTLIGRVQTPNGYALTVDAALVVAQYVLDHSGLSGYKTPSMLCGPELLSKLAQTTVQIG
jgi:short subunit dehydrogenase-like uncharacterized protein